MTGADGGRFDIGETGVLSFAAPPDFDDPGDADGDNTYLVTLVATDQNGNDGILAVTVAVAGLNEGPEIEVRNTSISVLENHPPDRVLAAYSATDPEDPDNVVPTWSLSGADRGDFRINGDGELTFRAMPDFERPADSNRDNEYQVTIRASDGRYYGTLDVTIAVEAVNEPPGITGNDAVTYQENGVASIATYRATDPEGGAFAWGLSGADSRVFTISETGVLTFNSPPDYEDPLDSDRNNVYQLTVQATDGESSTASQEVTVTVKNITD